MEKTVGGAGGAATNAAVEEEEDEDDADEDEDETRRFLVAAASSAAEDGDEDDDEVAAGAHTGPCALATRSPRLTPVSARRAIAHRAAGTCSERCVTTQPRHTERPCSGWWHDELDAMHLEHSLIAHEAQQGEYVFATEDMGGVG